MKILYIDQTGQLGGGELSLLDWLRRRNRDAEMVLLDDGPFRDLLEEIGVPVRVVPLKALKELRREAGLWKGVSALPNLLRLRRELREALTSADVLYANSQKAFILAALARRRQQPLVWHLRDILSAEHFSPVLRRLAVFFGNRFATCILVNSAATAAAYTEQGGRADKLRLVPDGIDPELFAAIDPEDVRALRQEICSEPCFLVGLFGRLAEWKGQHVLLEAVRSVPGLHVCLIGDALFGEEGYAQKLRRQAESPELLGRVHFLGFRKDIPALMRAMDVVVHASTSPEPLGRVIIEGMLAGRPVIAARAGGAAEIVVDGESGLLTAPGSAADLAVALERLKASPELAATLAQGGRERAASAYSLDRMVDATQAVLDEVCPAPR